MPFSLLGTTLTASLQGDSPWPVDYHKYNHAGYIVVRWGRRERKKRRGSKPKIGDMAEPLYHSPTVCTAPRAVVSHA